MNVRNKLKHLVLSPSILPQNLRYWLVRQKVRVPEHPEGIRFLAATSRADFNGAFTLLHDAYVKEGYDTANTSGMRATIYHTVPTTRVLVAKAGDRVVATISVIRDGLCGLPADEIVDLTPFRNQGEQLAELSSLAIAPEYRGNSGQILFCLLKYLVLSTLMDSGIDRVVACVIPAHSTLYEGLMGYTRYSRKVINEYGFVNGTSVICSTISINSLPDTFRRLYRNAPYHRNLYKYCFEKFSPREKELMDMDETVRNDWKTPRMDKDTFLYFFEQCTETLAGMPPDKRSHINRLYSIEDE